MAKRARAAESGLAERQIAFDSLASRSDIEELFHALTFSRHTLYSCFSSCLENPCCPSRKRPQNSQASARAVHVFNDDTFIASPPCRYYITDNRARAVNPHRNIDYPRNKADIPEMSVLTRQDHFGLASQAVIIRRRSFHFLQFLWTSYKRFGIARPSLEPNSSKRRPALFSWGEGAADLRSSGDCHAPRHRALTLVVGLGIVGLAGAQDRATGSRACLRLPKKPSPP